MDNTRTEPEFIQDKRVRKPYHAPELISLGEIQSIIQTGNAPGTDANLGTTCAS
jgi:hypothetical protein